MNEPALIHPQWVGDRQVWLDTDILHKIQFGDPTKGWPGDINLAVYFNPHIDCFELLRWENGKYNLVARQKPGLIFDERIIEELVRRDTWRIERDLGAEVEAHNDAIRARAQAEHDELVAEEVAPRLRRSFIKEGII